MLNSFRDIADRSRDTGRPAVGTFVTSHDAAISVVLATAGFQFLILDFEHGPMDNLAALGHIRAAALHGAATVVRALDDASPRVQSYFDIGATAVMVPKVESAATAQRIVGMSRYQAGGRGMCPGCDAARYDASNWADYTVAANGRNMVIPIIETVAGMENLAAIVAVDGIDFVMFGPGDLAQDMGLNIFTDADQLASIWDTFRTIVQAAGKRTMGPGGFGFDGADIVVEMMDLMLLRSAADKVLGSYRQATPLV